jgi:ribonuclease PH
VMTDRLEFVELQGTAERQPFSRTLLDALLELAESGITQLVDTQQKALRAMCKR